MICEVHGVTGSYARLDGGFRCSECSKQSVKKARHKRKSRAIKYLGGSCKECGYNKNHKALQFHHRDPSEKSFGISHRGLSKSWEKLKEELDKCDLLCANCHAEKH